MWKQVIGFEGLYEVSDDGQIRSIPRNGTCANGRTMSQSSDQDGYLVTKLRHKEKVVTAKVHRVVAQAFLENKDKKPQVNHKDGNKKNNHVSNLEWVTNSENIRHAKLIGLQMECPNRVKVQQIKDGIVLATFKSLKEAEQITGIGWTGISGVLRGTRKSAGGYQWERCND